ncbi:hypothetical protein SAMN03159428_04948 [Kosakonia radicincitans]|uniref:RiboL-PSP-HEPN domain-containing protein n=1 Tax=Kosakonia radicincitans TaxID=283686 RepID=A0AAX2EZH8_9ENTR|nr:hypothetical protein [Kosakonia radicincitans]SFF38524.1 hypothetical protein SAMN03159468_04975 [Kosakonia radicincitans]SFR26325.1 hypothetical protein SAMN03159514_04935 [Kosakonia radicincitans]SFU16854.1 hypothetical protein SAMN03159428_04948 [Kosakonia radicincitans]SFY32369.1 hypothetical protein SAMN03159436_04925 [Kosakonia radicincitans]
MSSIKEYLMEVEDLRRERWIEEIYGDLDPESDEWQDAAGQYSDWLDDVAEQAERRWFQDSLNDLDSRYIHAVRELDELHELRESVGGGIVYRLGYVHTVTVMEAFLMYSARALLNDDAHLEHFYASLSKMPYLKGKLKKCREAVLEEYQAIQDDSLILTETDVRRLSAQRCISEQTFHNVDNMKEYFDAVLKTPRDWPVDGLRSIVDTRQDLVHRNGVSAHDEPVSINVWQLDRALTTVRAFIDAVALTLRQETGKDGVLPRAGKRDEF